MEAALLVSAGLTALLGVAHSGLGEARLIGPLLAPDSRSGLLAKSAFARGILRFAWHLTSIAWWGLAAILASLALAAPEQAEATVLAAVGATLTISGLIVLVTSRGRHLAWPVFLLAACLAVLPVLV
ncbi:MAG TPA: hypothetical protein VKQ29_10465 [Aliidongia sp.]|nr:hypothetical protein [Aliidongia sp.]